MLGNKEIMAKNIRYYMELNDKTRNDVCKDLGFSYTTFADWIHARKYPRIDKIEMMANYFGISKANLVEDWLSKKHHEEQGEELSISVLFRQLNDKHKEEVRAFILFLLESERKEKNTPSKMTS